MLYVCSTIQIYSIHSSSSSSPISHLSRLNVFLHFLLLLYLLLLYHSFTFAVSAFLFPFLLPDHSYFCFFICIHPSGARVHSNSWGSFFSGNGFYAAADVDDYLYKHPVRFILKMKFYDYLLIYMTYEDDDGYLQI